MVILSIVFCKRLPEAKFHCQLQRLDPVGPRLIEPFHFHLSTEVFVLRTQTTWAVTGGHWQRESFFETNLDTCGVVHLYKWGVSWYTGKNDDTGWYWYITIENPFGGWQVVAIRTKIMILVTIDEPADLVWFPLDTSYREKTVACRALSITLSENDGGKPQNPVVPSSSSLS